MVGTSAFPRRWGPAVSGLDTITQRGHVPRASTGTSVITADSVNRRIRIGGEKRWSICYCCYGPSREFGFNPLAHSCAR